MKRFIIAILALTLLGCTTTTSAPDTASEAVNNDEFMSMTVKNKMRQNQPQFSVRRVVPSEIDGIYEIHSLNNIIYTDGNYLISGHIFTMDGERDLTQEKIDSLADQVVEVDTASALLVKEGSGAKQIITITDPECPYCAAADVLFNDTDTTRLVMFLPLDFHVNAYDLSVHILCAPNPEAEYKSIMSHSYSYFNVDKQGAANLRVYIENKGVTLNSCPAGVAQLQKMRTAIDNVGFTSTPSFVIDGKLMVGATPALQELIK